MNLSVSTSVMNNFCVYVCTHARTHDLLLTNIFHQWHFTHLLLINVFTIRKSVFGNALATLK